MGAFPVFITAPHRVLAPQDNEIHVWLVSLDQPTRRVAELWQTLRLDERERAARSCFDTQRRRFIVARGMLRAILGRYLEIKPQCVRFHYKPGGKPALCDDQGRQRPHFNLSHSADVCLVAITPRQELGVDVEFLRPLPHVEKLAERYFSPAEYAVFSRVPANQKPVAFWNCWTRKEAYIKAIGEGLCVPLNRFEVSLLPGEPARFLSLDGDPKKASHWSLFHLEPLPNLLGALAVPGQDWRLTGWRYPS